MADENCSPHGWTLDTLETYLTNKIAGIETRLTDKIDSSSNFTVTNLQQIKERTDMALTAADKAVTKAEIATEKRFDAVNEFRGAMDDQAKTMIPRAEYAISQNAMAERIAMISRDLNTLSSRLTGKSEGISMVGAIVLGVAIVITTVIGGGVLLIALRGHT